MSQPPIGDAAGADALYGADMGAGQGDAPPGDCSLCPRLADFRSLNRDRHPSFHNAPVPSFGPVTGRLLIVGLAPGLKGANQTGRPFTGDYAGDLLYGALHKFGFSKGVFAARADDGLELIDCRIVNAVRCVPPENKPTGAEITTCRRFLENELGAMPDLRVILALGGVAHRAVVSAFGTRQALAPFGHGATHTLASRFAVHAGREIHLADSYHCSRYNTNTGRLTEKMFMDVFASVRNFLDC